MDKYFALTVLALFTSYLTEPTTQQGITISSQVQNHTVNVGDTVSFECRFSGPVDCAWYRNGQIISVSGRYLYTATRILGQSTDDCSIEISQTTDVDFGTWTCSFFAGSDGGSVPSLNNWIIKAQTPTRPEIFLNGNAISQITFPITAEEEFNLICRSNLGNPAPNLTWELDGYNYIGSTQSVPVDTNLYNVSLTWADSAQILVNRTALSCIASHPGFARSQATTITITQEKPISFVHITNGEPFPGHEILLESGKKITLNCATDGEPKPEINWEFLSRDGTWMTYQNGSQITIDAQDSSFRCKARNKVTRDWIVSKEIVMKKKQVQQSNFGVIIGIIIAGLIIAALVIALIIFLYRRKKWLFAPKPSGAPPIVDGEVGEQENDKTTEKTPFSESHQETQYENLKKNGREEEINGKPDSSPIKNDQNDNKNPPEVVYAQLDLSTRRNVKVQPPPPEYEKTEYAEIQFNKDKHHNNA